MANFDLHKIPDKPGKTAIVTGANSGLGFETTRGLASKKIRVIMACRDIDKAEQARREILKEVPDADLVPMVMDLSEMDSVRTFAADFLRENKQLDLLVNNAGVMMPPYQKTEDGLELQFGVNYLGHFLLTALLIDTLTATPDSRIITLSSIAHTNAEIDFEDLQSEENYSKFKAYGQSKLACLIFAKELQRRLIAKGHRKTISIAVHPGVSTTELMRHLPKWMMVITKPLESLISHPPEKGAQPTLMAALSPKIQAGKYYGPDGFREMKGDPAKAKVASQAKCLDTAKRLWETSEDLASIKFLSL